MEPELIAPWNAEREATMRQIYDLVFFVPRRRLKRRFDAALACFGAIWDAGYYHGVLAERARREERDG